MQTSLRHRWMSALWAAFLCAAVLEMLVFALVDPQQLRWFGGETIDLSPLAVYTLAFFVFWAITAVGTGLAILLSSRPADARDTAPVADLRTY
ncbi:MAG TPA: hypothetical protein PKB14_17970 [Rubrivivax sp.]|nr:hypothetical protein [Rubrivivax sp.]